MVFTVLVAHFCLLLVALVLLVLAALFLLVLYLLKFSLQAIGLRTCLPGSPLEGHL